MRHALLTFKPRDVPVRVALRNTLGVVAPIAIGLASGHLTAGLAVATGALNAMFADQPGPYRLRMQRMLVIAFLSALSALVGASIGQWSPVLIGVTLLWGVAFGLLVALGPEPGRAGMTSMILLVITADHPLSPADALGFAGLVFTGGLIQMLLAIVAWPLQRYRPERHALAEVFRQLAHAAREQLGPDQAPPTSQALQDAQILLHGAHRSRDVAGQSFRVLANVAERIRVELMALCDLHPQLQHDRARQASRTLLDAAANVLERIARSLEDGRAPVLADEALHHLAPAIEQLRDLRRVQAGSPDAALLRIIAARADGLAAPLRSAVRNANYAGSRGELRADTVEAQFPASLQPRNPIATLRANLKLSSMALRHALRCGVCLALAVAASRYWQLDHGYWLPMTVAIVLKPDFIGTFSFGLLRVAGTLLGLAATTALLHYLVGNDWVLLGVFALLCFCFRLYTTVHYAIGVTALTGLIVIMLHFDGLAPGSTVEARAVGTVVGAALALLAYALWPTWENERLRPALAAMLDGYRVYFDAVLRGDADQRSEARLAARSLRTNARASLDRLHGEPRPQRQLLDLGEAVYANGNRLARASMALEAILQDADALPERERVLAFSERVDSALLAIADGIRNGPGLPIANLRSDERRLHAALDAISSDGERDVAAALAHACDRMTDTIDTLVHLLDAPTAGSANGRGREFTS